MSTNWLRKANTACRGGGQRKRQIPLGVMPSGIRLSFQLLTLLFRREIRLNVTPAAMSTAPRPAGAHAAPPVTGSAPSAAAATFDGVVVSGAGSELGDLNCRRWRLDPGRGCRLDRGRGCRLDRGRGGRLDRGRGCRLDRGRGCRELHRGRGCRLDPGRGCRRDPGSWSAARPGSWSAASTTGALRTLKLSVFVSALAKSGSARPKPCTRRRRWWCPRSRRSCRGSDDCAELMAERAVCDHDRPAAAEHAATRGGDLHVVGAVRQITTVVTRSAVEPDLVPEP